MNITLPQDVETILYTLNKKGYAAYAVGGCVRDMLLGKTPGDWDITTAALPEEIIASFEKTVPTGLKHGTVTVLLPHGQYEVTTFRIDGDYHDHRKPDTVTFTGDILQDLSRRDFTMNAMAYHPKEGLLDPFGGQNDIKKGLIRCVGDPMCRFDEDALRMLRAVRFSAQIGFSLHKDIMIAAEKRASLLTSVSSERIRDELTKILLSPRPEYLSLFLESGLLTYILPELIPCFATEQNTKYHNTNVGDHTLRVVKHCPRDLVLRLTALLHDIGKPAKKTTDKAGTDHFKGHEAVSETMADEILTRLRFDNKTKEKVLKLIRFHDVRIAEDKESVRRVVSQLGQDLFLPLLAIKQADAQGQHPAFLAETLRHIGRLEELYSEIKAAGDPLTLRDLAITGKELLALGYEGKKVGILLEKALSLVLSDPTVNKREILLKKIENFD